ncbi:beta-lactamase family protein [Candidatus Collierbacteria bacterium]|nr:beta-lactamase family protein [Candidatus Collierbacteria bacterium]
MATTNSENSPGYAMAVVKDGKTVLTKTAGLADLDNKVSITAKTAFRLASLSKQFTAMAVMILVERKKLSLKNKLMDFFPNYPGYGNKVTVRQLLTHTAGIPDHEKPLYKLMSLFQKSLRASPSDWRSVAISSLDLDCHVSLDYARDPRNDGGNSEPTIYDALKVLKNQPAPLFSPGSRYQYSDAGYVLLALIIEKVSGVSYRDFLNRNIFSSLTMNSSDVLDQTKPKIKNRALGYKRMRLLRPARSGARNDREGYENFDYDPLNYIVGDEGVYSSLEDMIKWNLAWKEEILVSRRSLAEAMRPAKLTGGNFGKAGFSWLMGEFNGDKIVYQDGAWVGFRNIIFKIPAQKLTVIILSNRTGLDTERQRVSLASQLAQKFLRPDKME